MKLSLKNYNKPSHKTFKKIADVLLFAVPVYVPVVNSFPLSDTTKLWIVSGLTFISATVKIISKFTVDESFEQSQEVKQ